VCGLVPDDVVQRLSIRENLTGLNGFVELR
jgi:hypothetical protein